MENPISIELWLAIACEICYWADSMGSNCEGKEYLFCRSDVAEFSPDFAALLNKFMYGSGISMQEIEGMK